MSKKYINAFRREFESFMLDMDQPNEHTICLFEICKDIYHRLNVKNNWSPLEVAYSICWNKNGEYMEWHGIAIEPPGVKEGVGILIYENNLYIAPVTYHASKSEPWYEIENPIRLKTIPIADPKLHEKAVKTIMKVLHESFHDWWKKTKKAYNEHSEFFRIMQETVQ